MANKPCKDCIHKEACITANPDMVKKTYQCEHYLPTADVVEIETLRSWLYSIATNNMGCDIKITLSEACEDIISRLDGLRMFAKEKGGDQ